VTLGAKIYERVLDMPIPIKIDRLLALNFMASFAGGRRAALRRRALWAGQPDRETDNERQASDTEENDLLFHMTSSAQSSKYGLIISIIRGLDSAPCHKECGKKSLSEQLACEKPFV
jgi:hypothetical protein